MASAQSSFASSGSAAPVASPGAPARSAALPDDPLAARATYRADVAAEFMASASAEEVLAEARRISAGTGLRGAACFRAALLLLAGYAWLGAGRVSPHTYGLARQRFDAACVLIATEGR